MAEKDSLVHEVIIQKIIEVSKDVYQSYKQKDYSRIACGILILCFVGYSFYKRKNARKKRIKSFGNKFRWNGSKRIHSCGNRKETNLFASHRR